MAKRTFGSKLWLGFGLTVALTLIMGTASVVALSVVVDAKDDTIREAVEDLVSAEHLTTKAESRISDYRAFILNGSQEYLDLTNSDREQFLALVMRLRATLTNPGALALLEAVSAAEAKHAAALLPIIETRSGRPARRCRRRSPP
jgi:CHASE3 domain sensor protein